MARDEAAVQLRKAHDGLRQAEQSFSAKKPIETVTYEAYPVASNSTQAGMQQNRRVEIVIWDKNGAFPAAAERTAGGAS